MTKEIDCNFKVLCSRIKEKFLMNPTLMFAAKAHFSVKIKSNRRVENMLNIDHLFMVLRRNGLLKKFDCLDTFQAFNDLLQDESYKKALEQHKNTLFSSKSKLYNVYADHRTLQRNDETPQISESPQKNGKPDGRREKMFRILADEISPPEFLSLARLLKFSENDINGFVTRISSDSARTMVLLGRYEKEKQELTSNLLLVLLDLIKRPDIAQAIKNL